MLVRSVIKGGANFIRIFYVYGKNFKNHLTAYREQYRINYTLCCGNLTTCASSVELTSIRSPLPK